MEFFCIIPFFIVFVSICSFSNEKIQTTFNIDYSKEIGSFQNPYSSIISWYPQSEWKDISLPPNTIKTLYPFLNYVQFFTATGGCYTGYPNCTSDRDLFVDPKDPTKGYDFDKLLIPVSNVLKQGLFPHIVTGNVPISLSSDPKIGVFGVNTEPPDDYNQYFDYIKNLGEEAVKKFGLGDWFTSEQDYFKLYDTTANALLSVIDKSNLKIGAHACTQVIGHKGCWDPRDFIDHVKDSGIHITFLSNSFYETKPGEPGTLETFNKEMGLLIERVKQHGIKIDEYGVDEGRILAGPERTWSQLLSREIGDSYQASFDSYFACKMHDIGVNYYSSCELVVNNRGLFGDPHVNTVSTNVAFLTLKFDNSKLLEVKQSGITADKENGDYFFLMAGKKEEKTVQLFFFNHNSNFPQKGNNIQFNIILNNIPKNYENANVTQWIVDDKHAQFWPTWWEDMKKGNITEFIDGWSIYSSTNYVGLSKWEKEYFDDRITGYQQLAEVKSEKTEMKKIENNTLRIDYTLIPYSVNFVEFDLF